MVPRAAEGRKCSRDGGGSGCCAALASGPGGQHRAPSALAARPLDTHGDPSLPRRAVRASRGCTPHHVTPGCPGGPGPRKDVICGPPGVGLGAEVTGVPREAMGYEVGPICAWEHSRYCHSKWRTFSHDFPEPRAAGDSSRGGPHVGTAGDSPGKAWGAAGKRRQSPHQPGSAGTAAPVA